LIRWFLANIISVAFYNYAGVAVTKELSSTTRVVIDNGRTVLVYIVSVTIFKATFHFLDVLGLILLILGKFKFLSNEIKLKHFNLGVGIYNGLWAHLHHRVIQPIRTTTEETTTLISDSNQINSYSWIEMFSYLIIVSIKSFDSSSISTVNVSMTCAYNEIFFFNCELFVIFRNN